MSVPLFKELDKSATDLLSKGFPVESHGFEVEGSADNGIKFKSTGTHQADGSVDALFETSKALSDHGVTIKVTAKTDKKKPVYVSEVAYEPKQVKGLKVTATADVAGSDNKQQQTYKLAILYKRGEVATSETTVSYSEAVEVASSLAVAHQSFKAGASATLSIATEGEKKVGLKDYGFKAVFAPSKTFAFAAVWATAGENTKTGANLWFKNDKFETSGDVTLNPFKLGDLPVFRFAVQHARDANTTLKARFQSKGNVALSIKQQLSDAVSVTLASETALNLTQISGHKYGASVNLKL